ncbi:Aste57867_17306 [Aphanomyces stellatus]|uniref:Aste57867_17306 protein n=1 Tax=Aphanomyces stellatus TaxID=120398 RepID=A0A485L9B4_9STRA|nr:hypothetical protein As57867_017247 [Aphanomyces stellatus]VFT94062.1 Aste57867_17306 [Aphanomyces stellatus]
MEVSKLFSVEKQTVLITGGSRGIGKMIAEGFVRNGARVYISARSEKDCDETAAELTAAGPGECIPIPEDLGSIEGCLRLAAALQQRESKLDVLVNNSGVAWAGGFGGHTPEMWSKVMDLNLTAPFFLTKYLLPLLQTNARIIMVGSVAGRRPQSYGSYAYDVSKAALHHLTRVLAADLAPRQITVNAIAPGLVPTKMTRHVPTISGKNHDGFAKDTVPLQRPGGPSDMAGATLFFASPAGAWVTGAVLSVDGGQYEATHIGAKL